MALVSFILTLFFIYILSKIKSIWTWIKIRNRKHELGDKIPGPKTIPFFGNALSFSKDTKQTIDYITEEFNKVNEKNEPFIRFWVGEKLLVIPINGNAARYIIDNELIKGDDYELLKEWLNEGLVVSSGEKWRHNRKLITPSFHFGMLKNYFSIFNNEAKIFIESLTKYVDTDKEINIINYAKRLTLDIICETAMGTKMKIQENPNHKYIENVEIFNRNAAIFTRSPLYLFKPIWYLFGEGFSTTRSLNVLKEFTSTIINDRWKQYQHNKMNENNNNNNNNNKNHDFLKNLLDHRAENYMTDQDVLDEVQTFTFAGHDTTATAFAFLVWALATHPDIQERLYEEICDVYEAEERDVIPDDLTKLPYLERVIKESLRRHPTVPIISRNTKKEINILGYTLPKDTNFTISIYHIHLNPKIYPDPMKFDPDRFLPENCINRDPYDFLPFSAGPRNCIGQKFSLFELKLLIIWALRRYKFYSKLPYEYIEILPEVVIHNDKNYPILITSR
ncbi:Cytochrome P450 4V2 [Strongyloides ratti]|uniref:Cytochrome P450 4V2 n=1 Tax=Strongyloides ratti TaxID=34506 RepID=A0A090L0Q0_STRRB|nr:Cytochrome P450 4V2 [Strongyloides ratti]CEF61074.1 Cytochrome P450 4V2 [Strongyloides ratti]